MRDEMMESQPTTKELNTYRVLVLCAIVILLEGFDIQAAGVSATKLALAFNLALFGKGMFLGASAVGIFVSSVLGGFLANKYGRRRINCFDPHYLGIRNNGIVYDQDVFKTKSVVIDNKLRWAECQQLL
jgi:hypothetical protein